MSRPLRRSARLLLTATVVGLAVACGPGASSPGPSAAVSASPSPSASDAPSPPAASGGGLAPSDVDTVIANAGTLSGTRIALHGFLLIQPDGARLCALVLESYPPQCGGAAIAVRGGVPPVILAQLDSTTDEPGLNPATWGTVVITGTFHAGDGTPTVDLDGITIVTPE